MINIGKVADLVLLMVDGSFGFEMVCILSLIFFKVIQETFEVLNILQSHGFPKVIGIITLKKKPLKNRYGIAIYQGEKLPLVFSAVVIQTEIS